MNRLKEIRDRLATAKFRMLAPYTYSPAGHHEEDHAVSLDGKSAINPMPLPFAQEVCAILKFAEQAREDMAFLLEQLERKEVEADLLRRGAHVNELGFCAQIDRLKEQLAKSEQAALDALDFYGAAESYATSTRTLSCGCCSESLEPAILDDAGQKARQAAESIRRNG
jgi:hypothetical protein